MNQNKVLELTKDIATDIIGGILIAVGVYNFAAAAKFPMAGVNGIALIFYTNKLDEIILKSAGIFLPRFFFTNFLGNECMTYALNFTPYCIKNSSR